ncbi:MAG: R.Pab1 family restriction endonuclease [Bifidobacteriaceae bacterium]|nr:R.Pab1 family restriction endonuclease [Bifidobacteriaceae bacterium]
MESCQTKKIAYFEIAKDNIKVFFEVLKMFDILSESHKYDVLEIIMAIRRKRIK